MRLTYSLFFRVGTDRDLMASEFLARSVKRGTDLSYRRSFEVFTEYRERLAAGIDPGPYFENCTTEWEKAKELTLFYRHLYYERGLREEQVSAVATALSYCLSIAGKDTTFLKTDLALRARKACSRSAVEARVHNQKRVSRDKSPVTQEILAQIRSLYWEGRSWTSSTDLDARGVWIAVAIGFDCGTRVGNVTKQDGPEREDHCIRSSDLTFEVSSPGCEPHRMEGVEAMRSEINGGLIMPSAVSRVWLIFVSSKTMRQLKSQMEPKLVGRRTQAEDQLLNDLVEWTVHSGTRDVDELATRYIDGKRRSTTRKEVLKALKQGAAAAGRDPSKYSTKSLRGGFSTAAFEAELPEIEINLRGGWVLNSRISRSSYATRPGTSSGGMALVGSPLVSST
jgi:hypothetical protein